MSIQTQPINVIESTKYLLSFNLLDSQGCATTNFKYTAISSFLLLGSDSTINIAATSGIAPKNYFFNQFKTCDPTITYTTPI